ncbi:MAG: phosphatidylserine decarboxylase family protein [Magnetococcales bacterium]|nr:phosphatidylserine decarboxylase family protein [Magnetococcales bacterium]
MRIPIAREGWPFVAGFAAVALLGTWFCPVPWGDPPLWLLLFWVIWFFRDPERITPVAAGLVVAPADGRVIAVDEVAAAPLSGRAARRISIFMNIFNVHVNRFPDSGRIVACNYRPGRFINAALDKASQENERMELLLQSDQGREIVFVQVAGLIARRIVCRIGRGDYGRRGERFGLIRFGSRVDVYLPLDATIAVTLGERTVAGETLLATITATGEK